MRKFIKLLLLSFLILISFNFSFAADSDGDGLSDTEEKQGWKSTIYTKEHKNGTGILFISDPNKTDSDNDNLNDKQEKGLGTNPNKADTDGDGINDYKEITEKNTNPLNWDTDGDGTSDLNDDSPMGGESSTKRYGKTLSQSISPIKEQLDISPVSGKSSEGIKEYIIYIAFNVLIPIAIVIGIVIGIIGFYKLMFSEGEDEQSKGSSILTWGTISIIIMMSAGYIGKTLVGTGGSGGIFSNLGNQDAGIMIAEKIYNEILFPFLKIALILVAGILFIILLIHAFKFLMDPDEEVKSQSRKLVVWNVVGILIILMSKEIVESIFGKKESITSGVSKVSEVGEGILSQKNFEMLYSIINWGMGLISFIVLAIIIYQTYLLMTKPDDSEAIENIKKNFLYIFVGLGIIAAGYLITNFLIIN